MNSLNNYDTRSQMALHIPLCITNKGENNMSFLGLKIFNKLGSNIKTTASFTYSFKKDILEKLR